jgi:hypothetical protein
MTRAMGSTLFFYKFLARCVHTMLGVLHVVLTALVPWTTRRATSCINGLNALAEMRQVATTQQHRGWLAMRASTLAPSPIPTCDAAISMSAVTHRLATQSHGRARRCRLSAEDDEPSSLGRRLNEMLDRPVIDPSRDRGLDEPEFLRRFKDLVQTDYGAAEAIYAGGVLAALLVFAQQLVKLYKNCYFIPDTTCPFAPSAEDLLNF